METTQRTKKYVDAKRDREEGINQTDRESRNEKERTTKQQMDRSTKKAGTEKTPKGVSKREHYGGAATLSLCFFIFPLIGTKDMKKA